MIGILIALLSGALMSVQGVFNTGVTKGTSIWVANSWVQFTALAFCIIAWFFTGRESFSGLLKIDHKYMLLGGVIGVDKIGFEWKKVIGMVVAIVGIIIFKWE